MTSQSKPNGSGAKRLLKSLLCSFKGLTSAFKYEVAFRQELLLAMLLFPLSFFIAEGVYSWVALNLSILFLLIVELINSAIEALADKITLEHDELIGRAKDIGSAAVLLATLALGIIWGTFTYQFFV